MAKITPIDIIKGVSSKFGGGNLKEYFATKNAQTIRQKRLFKIIRTTLRQKAVSHNIEFLANICH